MRYIFLFLSLTLSSTYNAQATEDVVKIATGIGSFFKPYHYINKDGELEGYDIDVGNAACELAQLKCEFHLQDWPNIISSLRFKKYDAIISAMSNNKNRRRVIDFSAPYGVSRTFIAINSDSVSTDFCKSFSGMTSVENPTNKRLLLSEFKAHLSGKTIVVRNKTKSHNFLEDNPSLKEFIKVKLVTSSSEAIEMLGQGKADIAFGVSASKVDAYNKQHNTNLFTPEFYLTGDNFGRGTSVGVRKDDQELKQKFSNALEQLKQQGKLKELAIKWFKEDRSPPIK